MINQLGKYIVYPLKSPIKEVIIPNTIFFVKIVFNITFIKLRGLDSINEVCNGIDTLEECRQIKSINLYIPIDTN